MINQVESKKVFKNDKDAFNVAFRELRKHGFVAKQDFLCCQGCAWGELPDKEEAPKVVFYHHQDSDSFNNKTKMLTGAIYLCWRGDIDEIMEILSNVFGDRFYLYINEEKTDRLAILPMRMKEQFILDKKERDLYNEFRDSTDGLKVGMNEVSSPRELAGLIRMTTYPDDVVGDSFIVLHYRCDDCGDEQVTDAMVPEDIMYSILKGEEYIILPCMECGSRNTIYYKDINSVELLFQ